MDKYQSLGHSQWECLYHVVFIPKCRRRTLYEELRKYLGGLFRELASQKEFQVEEGHLMRDHVHMLLRIAPKYAVSQVVGYIKGKSAIHLARVYGERKCKFVRQHFWARGCFVSTELSVAPCGEKGALPRGLLLAEKHRAEETPAHTRRPRSGRCSAKRLGSCASVYVAVADMMLLATSRRHRLHCRHAIHPLQASLNSRQRMRTAWCEKSPP